MIRYGKGTLTALRHFLYDGTPERVVLSTKERKAMRQMRKAKTLAAIKAAKSGKAATVSLDDL